MNKVSLLLILLFSCSTKLNSYEDENVGLVTIYNVHWMTTDLCINSVEEFFKYNLLSRSASEVAFYNNHIKLLINEAIDSIHRYKVLDSSDYRPHIRTVLIVLNKGKIDTIGIGSNDVMQIKDKYYELDTNLFYKFIAPYIPYEEASVIYEYRKYQLENRNNK